MADYKNAHLAWISQNPKFSPKEADVFTDPSITYYDIMRQIYSLPACPQSYAETCFLQDKLWCISKFEISKSLDKRIAKMRPLPSEKWFVTLGFNHATWNIKDCMKCINKILDMEWIVSAKANFELHRENGEHPHVHILMKTKEPKSRILDKCFRPLYTKKVVLKKNFIDVKPALECHYKYINLIKAEEKMKLVEADIIWRRKNNIPDFEKNIKELFTEETDV